MRAFAIDRFGDEGDVRTLPDPVPAKNELLVKITATGVNPVDYKIRDGGHGERPFPLILGADFAGVVHTVGSDVTGWTVGDRVFGSARKSGSYAEYTVVPADSDAQPIAKTPDGLSDAQAATLGIAGLTALACTYRIEAECGQTVLVFGATGAVGAFAVQILKSRNVRVIATARSGKEAFAKELGADEVIVYDREDVIDAIKQRHPDGIDAVIDLVNAKEKIKRDADIVRPLGHVVSVIGAVDEADFDAQKIVATNLQLGKTPQSSRASLEELLALMKSGDVNVTVDATHTLDEARDVLANLKAGRISGNVVLKIA